MSLQCPECGRRNTEVVSAEDLGKITEDRRLMSGAVSGFIVPNLLAGVLKSFFEALGKIFDVIKEKNKRKVIFCKDCGYWKKV